MSHPVSLTHARTHACHVDRCNCDSATATCTSSGVHDTYSSVETVDRPASRRRIPVSCWLALRAAHLPGRPVWRRRQAVDSLSYWLRCPIFAFLIHRGSAVTYTYCQRCCLLLSAVINLNLSLLNRSISDVKSHIDYWMPFTSDNKLRIINCCKNWRAAENRKILLDMVHFTAPARQPSVQRGRYVFSFSFPLSTGWAKLNVPSLHFCL